jgi:hypothetical protein
LSRTEISANQIRPENSESFLTAQRLDEPNCKNLFSWVHLAAGEIKKVLWAILFFAQSAALPQSPVIFSDDFSHYADGSPGAPQWQAAKGQWQVADGKFQQLAGDYDCAALLPYFLDGSFELSARVRVLGKYNGAGFVFHSESRESIANAQMARFDDDSTMLLGFFREGNYTVTHLANFTAVSPREWNTLRLVVDRQRHDYSLFWNDQPLREHVPLDCVAGYAGLQTSGGAAEFDDVILRQFETTAPAAPFVWPRQFALDQNGNIVVPERHRGVIRVVDRAGKILQEFGKPLSENGQLGSPVAVITDSLGWLVADTERNLLHQFSPNGKWLKAISAVPLDSANSTASSKFEPLSSPVAMARRHDGWLFVAEKEKNRVRVYDSQLRTKQLLREPRLQSPSAIAVRDSIVAVGAEGKAFIFIWRGATTTAKLSQAINLPWGVVNGLAWHNDKLFAGVGSRVLRLSREGTIERKFTLPSPGGWRPWGLAITPNGEVMIADFEAGKIVVTDTALTAPPPQITFPATNQALVQVKMPAPVQLAWELRLGQKSEREGRTSQPARRHQITLKSLHPSTLYQLHLRPAVTTIPPQTYEARPFLFMTPAPKAKTQFWEMRAVAIILANIWDSTKTPTPPPLPQADIDHLKNQLEDARQFYWMNSSLRFHLALDYLVVPQRLTRAQVFGAEDYYPPREGMIERFLQDAEKNVRDYQAVFYIACIQDSTPEQPQWSLRGKGGAFTIGVGAGKGYGYSWWEATRNGHNAGNNWLAVHEFHHQLDDVFAASGYAEYWFNHFSVSIGAADDFGEHFDGNAYILRHWPAGQWMAPLAATPRWGRLQFADDADGDGIPDHDPRLPIDEKRLGSNPRRRDSDNDGLDDREELQLANWVIDGWGETYAAPARFPNLSNPDADGDGTADARDPAPFYPWPVRIEHSPQVIGALSLPDFTASCSAWWNADSLFLAFELSRLASLKILVDAQADGWFVGRDNIELRFEPAALDTGTGWRARFFDAGKVTEWPQMRPELARQIKFSSIRRQQNQQEYLLLKISADAALGLEFHAGRVVAFNFAFRPEQSSSSSQFTFLRYLTTYEPNRFVKFILEER